MDIIESLENYDVPESHRQKIQSEFSHLDGRIADLQRQLAEARAENARLTKSGQRLLNEVERLAGVMMDEARRAEAAEAKLAMLDEILNDIQLQFPDMGLVGVMDMDCGVVQHSEWSAIGALVRKALSYTSADVTTWLAERDAKVRTDAVRECIDVATAIAINPINTKKALQALISEQEGGF